MILLTGKNNRLAKAGRRHPLGLAAVRATIQNK